MYQELFQLEEPPFRLTPDPQFLFASKQHARAKAYMESTIWLSDGFVVLTGEIGSGKTTLIESFLAEQPDDVVVAYIGQTQLTPVEFLQALLVEFGFKPFKKRKIELLSMLKDFLVEQYTQNRKVLLIVDEAQNLSRKVLEEIRLLSGFESQKEKVLRIILAGQPELGEKLDSPRLEQLMQRVRLRFHLAPLSKRETVEYVQHRLRIAGAEDREVFTPEAIDVVFRYTGGIPRLVNILCDTAMLCAFADEVPRIDARVVEAAVAELQWVDYSRRVQSRNRGDSADQRAVRTALGRLEILFNNQPVADFDVYVGRSIIGRTPDNDLQIRSKFISRHHAQIISDTQHSTVEDLNSTNGIFVDSRRVKRQRLADGDVIQIGEHKLVYRDFRDRLRPDDEDYDEAERSEAETDEADEAEVDDEDNEEEAAEDQAAEFER